MLYLESKVDAEIFAILALWLNKQVVKNAGRKPPDIRQLVALWDLGQRLGMAAMQNAVMIKIVPILKTAPTIPFFIRFAYEEGHGEERKPRRHLAVAKLTSMDAAHFELMIVEMPDALKCQVMMAMKRHAENVPEEYNYKIGSAKKFFTFPLDEE